MRRPFLTDVAEIEADPRLRVYGGVLAFLHVLSWTNWQFGRWLPGLLDSRGDPICWPFFENCHAWRVLDPPALQAVLWAYLAWSAVAIGLFVPRRLCSWAYLSLLGLNVFEALILVQDFRLRLNQHYMALAVTLVFLFLPDKRRLLRYLIVALYFWAGALKLDREWLSGAALYRRPLGVPDALVPLACAYVVVLEMVIVFGLLARKRWIFWSTFGQFVLFHVVSWSVVGYYYPLLMLGILSIFPLTRFDRAGEAPPFARHAPAYAMLGVFSFLQLIPALFPGDPVITGEGRLFALHMFDARVVCTASVTLRGTDGRLQVLPLEVRLPTRIKCDPIVYWNIAHALCRKLAGHAGFDDLDLSLRSRRSTEPELRPVIAVTGFCRARPTYDLWRPNPWILKG